jgi:aminoglycoside phosphotransferase (APT) family kinase protein
MTQNLDSIRPAGGAERVAAMLAALHGGLGGIAAAIPEPALAGPIRHFTDAIEACIRTLGAPARSAVSETRINELAAQAVAVLDPDETDVSSGAGALNRTIEQLVVAAHDGDGDAQQVLDGLLSVLADVETGVGAGRQASPAVNSSAQLGADQVTAYLRRRLDDPGAVAEQVDYVGGGYSKHTILVTATIAGSHRELVLRQVPEGQPTDTLTPEYEVLQHVYLPELPIAEPLWIEPAAAELGGPFFVSAKAGGSTLGDVEGASGSVPASFCEDLASFLAALHGIDADGLRSAPVPPMRTPAEIHAAIDEMAGKAVLARGRISPRLAAVVAWLHANVPPHETAQIIHGDVGLHNCLADRGRLTAVLDWERAHLGDPTEDLAYLRPSIEPHYSWPAFLEAYVAAGGRRPDPEVERFYTVWQDTWRHIECVRLSEDFFSSGAIPMLIAGFVLGPRFLSSAVSSAFGSAPREEPELAVAHGMERAR